MRATAITDRLRAAFDRVENLMRSGATMNAAPDLPAPTSGRVEGESWPGLRMTLRLSSVDGQLLVEKDLRLPSSFMPNCAVVTLRDLEGNILKAEYSEFGPKRPKLS
jgi:hypothetical protein